MEEILSFLYQNSAIIIAVLAALLSLQANFISRKNLKIAEKAFLLAEKQELEKNLSVTTYLNDSAIWSDKDFYYFSIFVTFKNESTQPNSLANPFLVLELTKKNFDTLRLNCNLDKICQLPKGWVDKKILNFPISVAPRDSVAGVVYSKVSKSIIEDKFINSIELQSFDALGNQITVVSFSPRDEHV